MIPKETELYQSVPSWSWANHAHASVDFSFLLSLVALIWDWQLTKHSVIMQRLLP